MASRRWLALVVAGALAAVACDGAPTPTPTSDRVDEIRAARRDVGPPAQVLGSAANDLATRVTALRLGDPADHDGRLELFDALMADTVPMLSAALSAAEDTALRGSSADIAAARGAWDDARDAARELVGAATADLAQIERLAEVDAQLAEVVAGWETPGSQTEQLALFDGLAARATDIADGLEGANERPPCSRAIARRVAAARHLAEASLELRGLVEARDGTAFDARRQVLAGDPYGLGRQQPAAADEEDRRCWDSEGATVVAGAEVRAALGDLEAALDPPDLSAPPLAD